MDGKNLRISSLMGGGTSKVTIGGTPGEPMPGLQPTVQAINLDKPTNLDENGAITEAPPQARGKPKPKVNENIQVSKDGTTYKMKKVYYNRRVSHISTLQKTVDEHASVITTTKEELRLTKLAITSLTKDKGVVVAKNRDLRLELDEIRASIRANSNKTGKSTKLERSKDIEKEIGTTVKETLFRTVKFAQPGKELATATKRVWNVVKIRLNLEEEPKCLDFDEFNRIYAPVVQHNLSLCRQYVQSRSQEAAHCE